jgi:membrane protease YdiL (CAAX protease family)
MLGTLLVAVLGVGVIALIGSALLLARLVDPPATPHQFGLRLTALRPAVGWTLVAWVGFYVFAYLWGLALGITEQDDLPDELGVDGSTAALVAVSLLVCVIAPIAEELFFRGFCFTALRRALGMLPAAALTGIIFGAIHLGGTDVEFIVPLMVFGFFLCLLYVWTDSLLPCIVLHALNNALALGVTQDWGAATVPAMAGAAVLSVLLVLPFARRAGASAAA